MKDYDYLSLIVEISPQHLESPEAIEEYNIVCHFNAEGKFQNILFFMLQWDYGEDTSDITKTLDYYEEVLIESDTHILARCESKNFGWQGDAFFLYRKEREHEKH